MDKNFVEVWLSNSLVGRIALTSEGLCAFEYDADFLENGFSISPYVLPLEKKVFIADRDPFDGNFGVFDDSLPDGWGTLLLDRFLKEQGKDLSKLSILDRLSLIGSNGRGALEYRPDNSFAANAHFKDFDKISSACQKILEEKKIDNGSLEEIYKNGGSSGGARPKVFAQIDSKEWLVKFRSSYDKKNIGEIEYKYSLLAKDCQIEMPETRLINGKYFAVERFDRTPNGRVHTISASGLLNAYYRLPSLDYADLLTVCKDLTKDQTQVAQLFRRMVFNVLIGNKDDHSKNFAFQYKNGAWKLSPAYDMLPSVGFNDMHTTSVNGKGNPSIGDIVEVAKQVSISEKLAKNIYGEIKAISSKNNK